jgi:hypothetical protein
MRFLCYRCVYASASSEAVWAHCLAWSEVAFGANASDMRTIGQNSTRMIYYNRCKFAERGCGRVTGIVVVARAAEPINTIWIPTSGLFGQYYGLKSDNTQIRHGIVGTSCPGIIWAEMWRIFGKKLAYWPHNLPGIFPLKRGEICPRHITYFHGVNLR